MTHAIVSTHIKIAEITLAMREQADIALAMRTIDQERDAILDKKQCVSSVCECPTCEHYWDLSTRWSDLSEKQDRLEDYIDNLLES